MKRDRVIETIKELPSEFDLDTIIERLIFIDKVEKGLQQVEEGGTISHAELKNRISKWSK
jgi:hypothetical protein